MPKTMIIHHVIRKPQQGPEDELHLQPGVNVVVGQPNTGKTKWLCLIDYLLGDTSAVEEALGQDLCQKYDSAILEVEIDGTIHSFERRWKESGTKTKVFIDGEAFTATEQAHFLLDRLGIPILHYPQGNPYGERTWPELGWRSIFRHIYRQQRYWSDLADKQPETEQHACILQFLCLAEKLYSDQYGQLIAKQKRVIELQAAKDQFMEMLQEVSKELIDDKGLSTAITPQSIDRAVDLLEKELEQLESERNIQLTELAKNAKTELSDRKNDEFDRLSQQLADLKSGYEASQVNLRQILDRLRTLNDYSKELSNELDRIKRAYQAGEILSKLKVTHCPACDQPVKRTTNNHATCYVCRQHVPKAPIQHDKRVSFEIEQIENELKEAHEVIATLEREKEQEEGLSRKHLETIVQISSMLKRIQSAAAQILPGKIACVDIETGRVQERLRQLQRMRQALKKRETLNEQINQVQQDISGLEEELAKHQMALDFEKAGDDLGDGINTYLNAISDKNPGSWPIEKPISFRIHERGFKVMIGKDKWTSKLGGTLTLYFVIAYHYALLALTKQTRYRYPGIVILDFPPELEDGTSVADKENFLLEPFIDLIKSIEPLSAQLIAMGSSFKGLQAANRIELTKVWR